jgi:hypothetical protein
VLMPASRMSLIAPLLSVASWCKNRWFFYSTSFSRFN